MIIGNGISLIASNSTLSVDDSCGCSTTIASLAGPISLFGALGATLNNVSVPFSAGAISVTDGIGSAGIMATNSSFTSLGATTIASTDSITFGGSSAGINAAAVALLAPVVNITGISGSPVSLVANVPGQALSVTGTNGITANFLSLASLGPINLTAANGNVVMHGDTSVQNVGALTVYARVIDIASTSGDTLSINNPITTAPGALTLLATTSLAVGTFPPGSSVGTLNVGNTFIQAPGNIILGSMDLISTGAVTVNVTGVGSIIAQVSQITAATGLTLVTQNSAIGGAITMSGNFSTATGALNVLARTSVLIIPGLSPSMLTAGSTTGVLGTTIAMNQIVSTGTITIVSASSGGVQIDSAQITAVGDLNLRSFNGPINFQSGNVLTANAGNLVALSSGNLLGNTNNTFISRGLNGTFQGGVVELGAGVAQFGPQFGSALGRAPGTVALGTAAVPGTLIYNPTLNANTHGAIVANIANGGGVLVPNSSFTVNPGGALVLDAIGPAGGLVLSSNTQIIVGGFRPIARSVSVAAATDLYIDNVEGEANLALAHIFVPGQQGAQLIETKAAAQSDDVEQVRAGEPPALPVFDVVAAKKSGNNRAANLRMRRGEMLIHPLTDTVIATAFGQVQVRKGAVASVVVDATGLRVAACSGPGDITVKAGERTIQLMPGEEVVVSDHALSNDERLKADGVGRRGFKSHEIGTGLTATISDFSIVSLMSSAAHLNSLVHPAAPVERRISKKLLKTAAVIQQVTRSRGAYQSRQAAHKAPGMNANMFKPVAFGN